MKLKVFPTNRSLCDEVALSLCSAVALKPHISLGLATGNTQILVYECMVQIARAKNISFKDVSTFNLDEYIEVPRTSESSFYSFMKRHFFDQTDVRMENTHFPYGDKIQSIQKNISDFENAMARVGGIDIQVLGLGRNGHIGFNEPSSHRNSVTRVVRLSRETLEDNKRDFDELCKPSTAVTMGVDTIYKAKKILLIATGENKAQAIKQMIEGEVSDKCPASFLRNHHDITVYTDKDASKLLTKSPNEY